MGVDMHHVDVREGVHIALGLRGVQGQLQRALFTRRIDLRRINRLPRVVADMIGCEEGVHVVDVIERRRRVVRFQADASRE